MQSSNLAAQLYTVREFTKTEKDFEETLRKIKAIGYAAVQVSAVGPIAPDRIGAIAEANGLRICATHTPYPRLLEELDAVIAEHKSWNAPYVGIGSIPEKYRGDTAGYRAFAAETAPVASRLAEAGLQLVYHNHRFEFEKRSDGLRGIDVLVEETDREAFGLELDLFWVQAGGGDPVEWIRKVEGRMAVVHLKDMAILNDRPLTAEIGEGNMNYGPIIEACRATGVEWYVVEQDECLRDPFESLAISYRNLQQYL